MKDKIRELGYLAGATRFRRISEKLYVDGDKIYKENGINFRASWFSVFFILNEANKHKSVVELANEIGLTHITIKNVLKELEIEGLVNIKNNPSDKRSKSITIAPKGRKLYLKLQTIWHDISLSLRLLFETGHPDFLNMLNRIEAELLKTPFNEKIKTIHEQVDVKILDYYPSLKKHFIAIVEPWLLKVLQGILEEEDKYTIYHPDKAYLENGGFVFFASYKNKIVGCVALKRLNVRSFEFAKLYINPKYRKLGIASKLIQKCITRCMENEINELWLQTTMSMPDAHKLFYKLGFEDQKAPKQMDVLKRTEKIMVKYLK